MAINKQFTFKNFEKLENLETFANKELEFIEKLVETEQTPHEIKVTFVQSPTHAHNKVDLHVIAGKLNLYASHEGGEDFFKIIKEVTKKMAEEIRKAKEEQKKSYRDKDFFKGA